MFLKFSADVIEVN